MPSQLHITELTVFCEHLSHLQVKDWQYLFSLSTTLVWRRSPAGQVQAWVFTFLILRLPLTARKQVVGEQIMELPAVIFGYKLTLIFWRTTLNDRNLWEQKCIWCVPWVLSLAQVLSNNTERWDLWPAAHHQGAMTMFLLYSWGALILSFLFEIIGGR